MFSVILVGLLGLVAAEPTGLDAAKRLWQNGRYAEAQEAYEAIAKGPFVMPRVTFSLKASEAAWRTFWQPVPPPGCHDLIATAEWNVSSLEIGA